MPYFPATARYSLPYRAVVMQQQRRLNLSNAVPGAVAEAPSSVPRQVDFGAQGGDPRRGVDMDLSTCVNRYGPDEDLVPR